MKKKNNLIFPFPHNLEKCIQFYFFPRSFFLIFLWLDPSQRSFFMHEGTAGFWKNFSGKEMYRMMHSKHQSAVKIEQQNKIYFYPKNTSSSYVFEYFLFVNRIPWHSCVIFLLFWWYFCWVFDRKLELFYDFSDYFMA